MKTPAEREVDTNIASGKRESEEIHNVASSLEEHGHNKEADISQGVVNTIDGTIAKTENSNKS